MRAPNAVRCRSTPAGPTVQAPNAAPPDPALQPQLVMSRPCRGIGSRRPAYRTRGNPVPPLHPATASRARSARQSFVWRPRLRRFQGVRLRRPAQSRLVNRACRPAPSSLPASPYRTSPRLKRLSAGATNELIAGRFVPHRSDTADCRTCPACPESAHRKDQSSTLRRESCPAAAAPPPQPPRVIQFPNVQCDIQARLAGHPARAGRLGC